MIESIDEQKCTGCDICFTVCPCDVSRPVPEKRLVRNAYRDDCQTCFACELDCPEQAIHVGPVRKRRVQAW
jgi:NAD-dependent dihydropyrimidine dehydrogenase PreA subunit